MLIDLVKATVEVKGRTTQALAVGSSVVLAVVGTWAYGSPPLDWLEAVWVGVQAGAMSIGIDQVAKKTI